MTDKREYVVAVINRIMEHNPPEYNHTALKRSLEHLGEVMDKATLRDHYAKLMAHLWIRLMVFERSHDMSELVGQEIYEQLSSIDLYIDTGLGKEGV